MIFFKRVFFPVVYLAVKIWVIRAKITKGKIDYGSVDDYVYTFYDDTVAKCIREKISSSSEPGRKSSRAFIMDDCKDIKNLDDLMPQDENSFKKKLLQLIDQSGMTNSEVYNRIDMDRRLFSKICGFSNGYMPSKKNILALAIGIKLTVVEAQELLEIAGYTFSNYSKTDIVVKYFLEKKEYNIFKINEVLEHYGRVTL